jgi:hypothetical protein
MAINKNHEFEELNGVKCGIVEKNVTPQRVEFLKKILEYNRYTVVVVPTPAPKVVVAKPIPGEESAQPPTSNLPTGQAGIEPPRPETFTVGVTDYTFNTINAIFGRMLKTPDGHIVTLAYWNQTETTNNDEIPYYEQNK